MSAPRINEQRLWDTIMETGAFGRTDKGGVNRLTLSDADRQVRDWFRAACTEAGCAVTIDDVGNIVAVRPGTRTDKPAVACGSHLDTQPTGGKFDGIYGVLAGLEAVRTLNDAGIRTEAPVAVIDWTNEEGSRFSPAMLASGVFAGAFERDYAYDRTDRTGLRFGDELARIGYRGDASATSHDLAAYLELHIEQGPVLETLGRTIGAVVGGQGQRWYDVRLAGQECHAGTTPMPMRRDALMAAAGVVQAVDGIARRYGPHGVGTVGILDIEKPSRNVIPGHVAMTIDVRHPDADTLAQMDADLREAVIGIARVRKIEIQMDQIWHFPPVAFDPDCIAAVRDSASALGFEAHEMVSGAGHDACYVARKVPTAMIFIPCAGGVSHNEEETATFDDVAAGANVLANTLVRLAGRADG